MVKVTLTREVAALVIEVALCFWADFGLSGREAREMKRALKAGDLMKGLKIASGLNAGALLGLLDEVVNPPVEVVAALEPFSSEFGENLEVVIG